MINAHRLKSPPKADVVWQDRYRLYAVSTYGTDLGLG